MRPLGRHKRRREDDIKTNLTETCLEYDNCIYIGRDREQWRGLVNTVMNIRVP
jgi:hypothetical protein